jgi:fungalysin metallopeptidase (M36)
MSINYIPNDPLASSSGPGLQVKAKRPNRPATRAGFTLTNTTAEGVFQPGTAEFLFWQCREAGLAALEAWEAMAGKFARWQGNRRKMALLQDEGVDINAFYDRNSFSFFHRQIEGKVFFSGASTDVVAHEVGHGLLDALRPDLWDAPFLESGAFHEAFGDCVAILTALNDPETRTKLLTSAPSLKKKNFVESTAEELSDGIRRLLPSHNAAEPRHAHNDFQYAIPETLPDTGGPGELINEVHSFGMIFSGCFYDLIAGLFAAQSSQTSAGLLAAVKTAGDLLMRAASTAEITPRFLQSVGRTMILVDEEQNGGQHRDVIRAAFAAHNIQLGANALLAPVAVLAGKAPGVSRRPKVDAATRRDLVDRLGLGKGARLSVDVAELPGRRFARVIHSRDVALGGIDKRLKGVSVSAPLPVLIGASNGRAAVMGALPETVSTDREVESFVRSLVKNGQIEFGGANGAAASARAAIAGPVGKKKPVSRETHRVRSVGGKKVLERVRFHCDCRHR